MERSAPETESAKDRVPEKAMGHVFVIQGPQEKPVVNVLTVIFCHTKMGIKPFAHHVIILAPAIAQAKFYIPSAIKTQINLVSEFFLQFF